MRFNNKKGQHSAWLSVSGLHTRMALGTLWYLALN